MHILIVEDEKGIVDFLKQGLEEEGYTISSASDGEEGLRKALELEVDLVLLDWMLPKIQGIDVCKRIRKEKTNLPIIFLTAKDTVQETIEGLKAGANDYIKKPFSFDELLERTKIHFRTKDEVKVLTLGNITIDKSKFQVFVDNKEVSLTQREFELLEYLIKNKGKVCTRTNIIEDVWDIHFEYDTGVIDVFMNAIRKKLNLTKDQDLIKTIRGIGYIANDN
ncbi:two component transcriptional regulator, winged helix family protein [Flavobacteria bacterium BAL38]|jgi:two-component system, OmpR family, response regulator ArlR|nr:MULTISPECIES: response regulator transcription factor [unclassified Flavobacterium]EAZ95041.1 two component transcriptional regulator, winged helix family protein [Flavobacteria bacterium BAL38]MDP5097539.1 response regulator transcription factor [Flavobacterium sp.]MQP52229.1 response regulator [Flavobacterium sp. LMO9]MQP62299.1 response regulator [Flavobacterium sp. LMO6]